MPSPTNDTPVIELRNLGPKCESDLAAIGVHTAGDIRKRGIEETFQEMMFNRMARGDGGKCMNAAYLYALYGAMNDCDWREVPEKQKAKFKKLTAKLRAELK